MKKATGNRVKSQHKQAIIQTCATLGIAFVCMIGINIYAYLTIVRMSETYSTIQNAAIHIKLQATNSNLLFREIVSGYSKKDMNEIWELLKRAKSYSSSLSEIDKSSSIKKKLDDFKNILIKCNNEKDFVGVNAEDTAKKQQALRNEYNSVFSSLIKEVDVIEKKVSNLIADKLKIFKVLYIALLVNILLFFGFVVFTFKRYISRQKQAEEELLESEENLNLILDTLDSMIISVDSEGTVSQWNNASSKYFDISSSSAIGKVLWDIVPFMQKYKLNIEKVFHSKKAVELQKEKNIVVDTERSFHIGLHPLAHGRKQVLISLNDITSLELKDEQIRQSQKMEVVENLVGGLAHDFNNVLGAITGTISMMKYSLENKDGTIEEIKNNMDVIESSTERAVVMIQQLLSLSTKHEVKLVPVDLNNSVKHVIKICKNTFDKKIQLAIELYDIQTLVKADSTQIEQVLLNLCDNAMQAMTIMRNEDEPAGGTLTISMDRIFPDKNYRHEHPRAVESSYWILHVSDTGIGMDKETVAKIFDPFFTTKEQDRASGLGLTLVNDIITKHNGFLEINSELGVGTTFSVFLPEFVQAPSDTTSEIVVEEEETDSGWFRPGACC